LGCVAGGGGGVYVVKTQGLARNFFLRSEFRGEVVSFLGGYLPPCTSLNLCMARSQSTSDETQVRKRELA
jgi:hypothetical protein